jgi:class 3 adenylate cyclase
MQCPSCGSRLDNSEVLCQVCGALLAMSSEEMTRVERFSVAANTELLCVMFCDISGFTGIATRSLPFSQKLLTVHTVLTRAIIERDRAGEIVNTAGDGVLAVFANPATATQRALDLHAAAHQYNAGSLDPVLCKALDTARVGTQRETTEAPYQVHIGLHLGLVTRGGHTARDVFGHTVNAACRLSSLAAAGQTYMSEAVAENARLILDDGHTLQWETWRNLPVQGMKEPMNVIGVAQAPYSTLIPPAGVRPRRPGALPRVRGSVPRWLAIGGLSVLSVLLGVGIFAGLRALPPRPTPPRVPIVPAAVAPAPAPVELPPLVGSSELLEEPTATTPAPPDAALPPVEPSVVALDPPLAAGSASTTALPAPDALAGAESAPPPEPSVPHPAPPGQEIPELGAIRTELLPTFTPISFANGQESLNGLARVWRTKDHGMLIAVGVNRKLGPDALLALFLDGDNDGQLTSQASPPYSDAYLCAGGPEATPAQNRYATLANGVPDLDLIAKPGIGVLAQLRGDRTIWCFRVLYEDLGVTNGQQIHFQLKLWPTGAAGSVLTHPVPGRGALLRPLRLP